MEIISYAEDANKQAGHGTASTAADPRHQESLRELSNQLSLLNHHVSAHIGGWVARERDPSDRRAIVVRALRDRNAELFRLYAGMNTAMDQLGASYGDDELQLLADFLHRTTNAGRTATDQLASD
jgi:DNA-binding MarR family transcriptional regulator